MPGPENDESAPAHEAPLFPNRPIPRKNPLMIKNYNITEIFEKYKTGIIEKEKKTLEYKSQALLQELVSKGLLNSGANLIRYKDLIILYIETVLTNYTTYIKNYISNYKQPLNRSKLNEIIKKTTCLQSELITYGVNFISDMHRKHVQNENAQNEILNRLKNESLLITNVIIEDFKLNLNALLKYYSFLTKLKKLAWTTIPIIIGIIIGFLLHLIH